MKILEFFAGEKLLHDSRERLSYFKSIVEGADD